MENAYNRDHTEIFGIAQDGMYQPYNYVSAVLLM
jgi:hypothetical protein